jgi:uncharacterized coiled-coil protein SlyX
MTTEITGEWLTYAEAGKRLGITAAAARQLSRRRGWQRRTPNAYGVRAEILVPQEALEKPPQVNADGHRTPHGPNGVGDASAAAFVLLARQLDDRVAEQAETIGDLRQRLDHEQQRVARAEHQVEELRTELGDALAAERIAAGEAAGLREEADRRRRWGLVRRLCWAIRV